MSHERFNAVIVDDDSVLLDGLRAALRTEPYDLHTAPDAELALPMIARIKPEVVVTDYHLPGMAGAQLLANTRAMLPDTCRILMTGSPTLTMAVEAINEGAVSRLFLKPFQTIHLAVAMREALERAEMARLSLQLLEQARMHAALASGSTGMPRTCWKPTPTAVCEPAPGPSLLTSINPTTTAPSYERCVARCADAQLDPSSG
jgi:DNA-binding NtrC family response regulator